MSKARQITHAELLAALSYDPETGIFRWKIKANANGAMPGMVAGYIDPRPIGGYRYIGIHGYRNKASRLAWFYMTGRWPQADIDHINRNRLDDRWCNLREATRAQNLWNTSLSCRNKSGVKGVSWDPTRNKWTAHISAHGKQKNLGRFSTLEEARAARIAAADRLHGDFTSDHSVSLQL